MTTCGTPERRRRALRRHLFALGVLAIGLLGSTVVAAGPSGNVTRLVNVADTRELQPGFTRWIADVYNSDLILFGGLVVVIMAGMGGVLGLLFDRLMARLGIHLGKLDHHE